MGANLTLFFTKKYDVDSFIMSEASHSGYNCCLLNTFTCGKMVRSGLFRLKPLNEALKPGI